ncbi:hypothetical protein [Marinobacter sp. CHS3-4]|uniref:hypothetical protein n=1 Tax=Marinobacter sp. CHS3-4 TaxID=3045174 RepID=UPI0024B6270A|nr:hypothetical protein [Marinobacter sp. CHS3-4]MDI9245544.1 hypothetical protein [Marinobacter sp. CHS3-4]
MTFKRWALAVLFSAAGVSAYAQTGHPELDRGLAQFALGAGNGALALRYTQNAETEQDYLLRAKALLKTGGQSEAVRLLDALIEGDYYRGEAAFLKSSLVSNDQEERRRLLQIAAQKGHGEVKQQASYQLAEMARTNGRPDTAGKILASMDTGYWAALGYMNIAADYGSRDLNPSRALISLRVAMAMAEEDPNKERGEALKAQLLVRAGLLAYESEDYDKAITFLEKVRLDSYSTPQGLYLHGLALTGKGKHRDAMQSWHRAKKYPLAFSGVAESWLGTGRGYDLTGYLGQAGEAFLSASATYESERVTLRKLADMVREKGAYAALLADAGETRAEWFLADSRMLTQPRSAYLLRFMENAGNQAAVHRVKELDSMLARMERQEHTLKVLTSVLDERLANSASDNKPALGHVRTEIESISARLIAARQNATPGSSSVETIRHLAQTLKDLETSTDRFDKRLHKRDQRLRVLHQKASDALEKLDHRKRKATDVLRKANAALDQKFLAYIDQESERMLVALERAEQQIAHLYEYLALQNLGGGSQ